MLKTVLLDLKSRMPEDKFYDPSILIAYVKEVAPKDQKTTLEIQKYQMMTNAIDVFSRLKNSTDYQVDIVIIQKRYKDLGFSDSTIDWILDLITATLQLNYEPLSSSKGSDAPNQTNEAKDQKKENKTKDTNTPINVSKGTKMQFGLYPQSEVKDETLISSLNKAAGQLPSSDSANLWTAYGYFIEDKVESYMWYIDLILGGHKYRGVYFTSYRPSWTSAPSSIRFSYQDDNGYTTSNVYWFKYEPITWRVLDVQAGKAFLMANLVLDSQDYHYSNSDRIIGGSTVYSNNYKESHIRSWLNDNFYNTAFSTEEKARIQTTTVDNSVASTGYSSNPYACANTSDKVFLLSYAEATSATYGLSTTTSRQLGPSAYAKAQCVFTPTNSFNNWWLRSPSINYDYYARRVNNDGDVYYYSVSYTYYGVVPALWISL